eukprot:SAG22_NODE_188_length_15821_cov_38.313319_22_plen_230_part_00
MLLDTAFLSEPVPFRAVLLDEPQGPPGASRGGFGGGWVPGNGGRSGGGFTGFGFDTPPGFGQQRQQQHSAASRFDRLPPGTAVLIQGLSAAAEHNGKAGTVAGFDPASGRYIVKLESGRLLRLRPGSCQQVVPAAELVALRSRPELNGQTVRLVGVREPEAAAEAEPAAAGGATGSTGGGGGVGDGPRYTAVLADGRPVALSPRNVRLPAETRVRLAGLVGSAALNGTW